MALLSEDTYALSCTANMSYSEFIQDLNSSYMNSDQKRIVEFDANLPELTADYIKERKYEATWWSQFCILYKRSCLNIQRQMRDNLTRGIVILIFSLLMLVLYTNVSSRTNSM